MKGPGLVLLVAGLTAVSATGGLACEPGALTIAIDVGHTPEASGALSARGKAEYGFNRDFATVLQKTLQDSGFSRTVVMQSRGIGRVQLVDRAKRANVMKADLFVSIHHDSVQDRYMSYWTNNGIKRKYSDTFMGYSIFLAKSSPQFETSLTIASSISENLLSRGMTFTRHHSEPIPGEGRAWIDQDKGIYEFGDLVVLKNAQMPALLIEVGVIANRREEETVSTTKFRSAFSTAIAAGLAKTCDVLTLAKQQPNQQPGANH